MERHKLLRLYHLLGMRITQLDTEGREGSAVPASVRGDGWYKWFTAHHDETIAIITWRSIVRALIDIQDGKKPVTMRNRETGQWVPANQLPFPSIEEFYGCSFPFDPSIHGPDNTIANKRKKKRQRRQK